MVGFAGLAMSRSPLGDLASLRRERPSKGQGRGFFELGGGASDLECGEPEGEAFRGGRARGAGLKQGAYPALS